MFVFAALLIAQGSPSLLGRIVPHPTGRNGYEEYLQAADLLQGPEENVYAAWTPGVEPKPRNPSLPDDDGPSPETAALDRHLRALSPLDVRREELQKFGQVLLLVRRGNGKPVFDPRPDVGLDTLFPEYARFRAIARFAARAATVYAADGQTDRAVEALLDQIAFADNASRSVLIANLVGSANIALTLSAFADLLPRLSRTDALRIQRAAQAILARPVAARAVLPAELSFTKAALRTGFAGDGKDLFEGADDGKSDPKAKAMAREFGSLTQFERTALRSRIEARLDARALAMDRVLAGPEREWSAGLARLADEEEASSTDLESGFIAMVTPIYSGYATVALRVRTQLRLLDLHARLLQYRWDFGRYPGSIEEIDPLTESRYLYENRPAGTIRVASKGVPQTGEIELKYRRAAATPTETGGKP